MEELFRRMRGKRAGSDRGFTLIELLVVVVIIGVLVAIAIPVYLNYREGAADKAAQSDIRGAIATVEAFYTQNSNKYPDDDNGDSADIPLELAGVAQDDKITLSDKTKLKYDNKGDGTYSICAVNDGGSKTFRYFSKEGGSVKEIGDKTAYAACT